jgi:serine protease AprX
MAWMRIVTMRQLGCLALAVLPVKPALAGDYLTAGPVVVEKPATAVSSKTLDFLSERDSTSASVWVFFTDKGIVTSAEFDSAALTVTLTERGERRRQRSAASEVLFVDLPVYQSYVDQIVALGATHRRSSRWLNAASFNLPLEILPAVAALASVAKIVPVTRFRLPTEIKADAKNPPLDQALSEETFNYGESQAQILQIGVAAAHARGLSGRGVTLTMTDTGFRKSHLAFAAYLSEGRVLGEYDFVMNDGNTAPESGDPYDQADHGTLTWSVAAGFSSGHVIGPAYNANVILCKTENTASETPVEEDNWVAALEFADSIGTDVISTSLGYSDWYNYSDMDGQTAVITLAANTCDALGIVLVVSAGNEGSLAGTISAPADAFDILAVGAVSSSGLIGGFSSRGPTYDGRTKPEICAMGVDAFGASSSSDVSYQYASGTSLAAPLIAGAACLLIEARPELTPAQVRQALKATATRADHPDNNYGWGIADLTKALKWPVTFTADVVQGAAPLQVSFTTESWLPAVGQTWDFGDGTTSIDAVGQHLYQAPGLYNVMLTYETDQGTYVRTESGMIRVHADSLSLSGTRVEPGERVRVDVYGRNYLAINQIEIPFTWDGSLAIKYDSFSTAGLRTSYFPTKALISIATSLKRATILLRTPGTEAQPSLSPGTGPVASLYFTVPAESAYGVNPVALISYSSYSPSFQSGGYEYNPTASSGYIQVAGCCIGTVGDINGDGSVEPTIGDISTLIDHLFLSREPLICVGEADVNKSGGASPGEADVTIGDVSWLIDYLYISGPSTPMLDCY